MTADQGSHNLISDLRKRKQVPYSDQLFPRDFHFANSIEKNFAELKFRDFIESPFF